MLKETLPLTDRETGKVPHVGCLSMGKGTTKPKVEVDDESGQCTYKTGGAMQFHHVAWNVEAIQAEEASRALNCARTGRQYRLQRSIHLQRVFQITVFLF